jgi:transposase InsO family protein
LRQKGYRINRKRVRRLCRQEGLKVPKRQIKRRRLGHGPNGVLRKKAQFPGHVWTCDFLFDQTEEGRLLKMLTTGDEFSRESLGIAVDRHITARKVKELLMGLLAKHGAPAFIRCDNGPEFIAQAIRRCLEESGVATLYIAPGSPWENAYSETFHSRFRDELLNREVFTSLAEARVLMEEFRLEYNERRPHSSLGYQTPATFRAAWERQRATEVA